MRPAVMALTLEVQECRENAEGARKNAARLRKQMDEAEAAALDYDNRAIDMEDAITKLEEPDQG